MDVKELITKFLKFGVVGFSGVFVDEGFLFLFNYVFGVNPMVSKAIGFTAAATSNYFLNRIWTFKSKEKRVGVEYLKFFAVSLIGLAINLLVLKLQMNALPNWDNGWRLLVLNLGAIAVGTIWNFFGNMLFTFRKSSTNS